MKKLKKWHRKSIRDGDAVKTANCYIYMERMQETVKN